MNTVEGFTDCQDTKCAMGNQLEVAEVMAAREAPAPPSLRPVPRGMNNRSWYVDAGGERYVLRVYQRPADPLRIAREHAVLRALGAVALPFRVPVPLTARGSREPGAISRGAEPDTTAGFRLPTAPLVRAGGREERAALFPLIPGRHPERIDPVIARAAGAALGELDTALARVDLPSPLADTPSPSALLDQVHPAVAGARLLPGRLGLDAERRERFGRILAAVAEAAPGLYASLPYQWIHADFARVNLLMGGGRVTGVLDFEFAHVDLRALDLAWAIDLFAFDAEMRAGLALLDAFGRGYTERRPLTEAERRALPMLIRLYRAVVVVHWCARYLDGSASRDIALGNIDILIKEDAWLSAHGDDLVERALRWPVASKM